MRRYVYTPIATIFHRKITHFDEQLNWKQELYTEIEHEEINTIKIERKKEKPCGLVIDWWLLLTMPISNNAQSPIWILLKSSYLMWPLHETNVKLFFVVVAITVYSLALGNERFVTRTKRYQTRSHAIYTYI